MDCLFDRCFAPLPPKGAYRPPLARRRPGQRGEAQITG